jgi:hypothetical protein
VEYRQENEQEDGQQRYPDHDLAGAGGMAGINGLCSVSAGISRAFIAHGSA